MEVAEDEEQTSHTTTTDHHRPPLLAGLTPSEHAALLPTIETYHLYMVGPDQCSSLLSQRIRSPSGPVWSILRRFDYPQIYKHFIRSCSLKNPSTSSSDVDIIAVGCLREVSIISGLPASTSTERLDVLDEEKMVTGFTIIGGEHRLRNYRSVTSVREFMRDTDTDTDTDTNREEKYTVVLESYVVDVPEGNTVEDTRLFADMVVRLNLQKLAAAAEGMAAAKTSHHPKG